MSPTITTADAAIDAAQAFDERNGPLATLAAGIVPQCFARLRIRLDELHHDALAALTLLGLSDDPDDPLERLGRREMSDITSRVAALKSWLEPQQCTASVCKCPADQMLRTLLEDQLISVQFGYRRGDRSGKPRPISLMAGYWAPAAQGNPAPYVVIDYRNNIAHAVQHHRGWRARLITAGEPATDIYLSTGYPETPVSRYYKDTRACAAAVAAALQL